MSGANTKIINRRIKSIVNTRKITKAMELVAASKMRKAVSAVLATRPYASLAWQTVGKLTSARKQGSEGEDAPAHPLLTERSEVKKTLAVLVTSDRGLCGGFNAQILRTANEYLKKNAGTPIEWIAVGKRAEQFLRRRKQAVVASFGSLLQRPDIVAVRPLARLAADGFVSGTYDEVAVLYNDFVSAILQKPRSKIMLPLRKDSELGEAQAPSPSPDHPPQALPDYLFEPDPGRVLDLILPRILEVQFYQAILESLASEHSARMLAMRNATESASEMIDDLRFTMNQARQAGITQEIAEISAGSAALTK